MMRHHACRAALALALLAPAGAALAHGEAPKAEAHGAAKPPPGPGATRAALPVDPMSLLEVSEDSWSVSKTEAGCFLMSPHRKSSSRLALGQHPTLGLALFMVDFAMAASITDGREPVMVRAGGQELMRVGRPAGKNLMVIPLQPKDAEASLAELQDNGTLWLELRNTWVTHGGRKLREAIAQFRHDCPAG